MSSGNNFPHRRVPLGPAAVASVARTSSTCDVVMRSVDELRPNPKTARTHPNRKIKDLANAIKTLGSLARSSSMRRE
jgi:hypothetical protein